ncbi:MAG: NUDIX hydrolase, partial [Oceanobacter sp.]
MPFNPEGSSLYRYLSERWAQHDPRSLAVRGLKSAAVLVPVMEIEGEPWMLLTLRAQHMPTHKGEVAFPGGKCEESDESSVHTALREAQEEVGLNPADVAVVGCLDEVTSIHGFLVTPVLAVIDEDAQLSADPRELDCYFKVPLSLFQKPPTDYFERGKTRIP